MSSLDPVILTEIKKIQAGQAKPAPMGDYSSIDIPIAEGDTLTDDIGFVDKVSNTILSRFPGQVGYITSIPVHDAYSSEYPSSISYASEVLPDGNTLIAYQTASLTGDTYLHTVFAIVNSSTGKVISTNRTNGTYTESHYTGSYYSKSFLQFVKCADPNKFILLITIADGTSSYKYSGKVSVVPISISNNSIVIGSYLADLSLTGGSSSEGSAIARWITFKLVNDNTLVLSCPYTNGGSNISQIKFYKFTGLFSGTPTLDTTLPAYTLPTPVTSSDASNYMSVVQLPNNLVVLRASSSNIYLLDITSTGVLNNARLATITVTKPGYSTTVELSTYIAGVAGFLEGGSYTNGILTNPVCFLLTNTAKKQSVPAKISSIVGTTISLTPLEGFTEIFKLYTKERDSILSRAAYTSLVSKNILVVKKPIGNFLLVSPYATSSITGKSLSTAVAPHICRQASFLRPYKNIAYINSISNNVANVRATIVDNTNAYKEQTIYLNNSKTLANYAYASDGASKATINLNIPGGFSDVKNLIDIDIEEYPTFATISFTASESVYREIWVFVDGLLVSAVDWSYATDSGKIKWEGVVGRNITIIPWFSGYNVGIGCNIILYGVIPQ